MNIPEVNIRAMEPEDLDILYSIENDKALWNVGITNVPYSRYALRDYLAHSASDIYTDKQVRLMIDNARGDTVGIVDIVDFNPQNLRAELGIVIQQPYRGMGYAHAAIAHVMDYSRNLLHLHQLYALIANDNENSKRLFEGMGFSPSALLRDWLFDGARYHDVIVMQIIL